MSDTPNPIPCPPATEPRDWRQGGLDSVALNTLRAALPTAQLQSLLIDVMARRAAARRPAEVMRQWREDRFVAPAVVGPRELMPVDAALFEAAAAYEAIELSPLAPLGSCSAVALGSARRIVAAVRGGEVVSDPTNVMALECARRLAQAPRRDVHLATSHRCVRAQAPPPGRGFGAHFRLFALASAGHERAEHGFVVEAAAEHIGVYLRALQALQQRGYAVAQRRLRLLCAAGHEMLAERVARRLSGDGRVAALSEPPALETLTHAYYDGGLRFMIDVGPGGNEAPLPMIDGGAFCWLHRLAGNAKLSFVASAIGTQLLAVRRRR
jgi:hypothetical protein